MVMRRYSVMAVLVFCLCFAGASFVLAQEGNETAPAAAEQTGNVLEAPQEAAPQVTAAPEATAPEKASSEEKATEWVWGEVVSIDQAKKEIALKHLDYETYEEVQTTLQIDEKTTFENAANLGDVKVKDHVTVDYHVKDGANIAELVVVEKEGTMKEEEKPMEMEQGVPAEGQPANMETPAPAEAPVEASAETPSAPSPEPVPAPAAAGNETAQ